MRIVKIPVFLFLTMIGLTSAAQAEEEPVADPGKAVEAVKEKDIEGVIQEKNITTKALGVSSPDISGLGFGVGIGVNTLSKKSIESAKIINNAVIVENESRKKTQFWLEAHYSFGKQYTTWKCLADECFVYNIRNEQNEPIKKGEIYFRPKRFFHGPFFAVNVSDSDSVINGSALGYMLSWRKVDEREKPTGMYFNLGFGASTSRIKELGGGLQEGQTVPAGTQIEYKTRDANGLLVLFSVGL